jgi:hypothetical protein
MNKYIEEIGPYFDWLSNIFGHLADECARHNITADELTRDYLRDSGRRNRFRSSLMPDVCRHVMQFWKEKGTRITAAVNSFPGLKARFGGDIGPQRKSQFFEKVGLYFDTIIVPDPLLRIATLPSPAEKNRDYFILKYGIAQV